ncbi:hypothetical protein PENSPDRAFT_671788 [Peniophora sp. CONT]|nr:hypothetical protein PENSPDRAFT_671788 [Peniophora sp. CONT]
MPRALKSARVTPVRSAVAVRKENDACEVPLGAEPDRPRSARESHGTSYTTVGRVPHTLQCTADQTGRGVDGPVRTAEGAVAGSEKERQPPRSGETKVSEGEVPGEREQDEADEAGTKRESKITIDDDGKRCVRSGGHTIVKYIC